MIEPWNFVAEADFQYNWKQQGETAIAHPQQGTCSVRCRQKNTKSKTPEFKNDEELNQKTLTWRVYQHAAVADDKLVWWNAA
jgi:hypothetical protein